jgi:acetolactate synthase-1/3 small subunit
VIPGADARRVCSAVVKHTLSVLTENKPGVLSRVAGLFTRRGFNIDSLAVSPTEDPSRSRMTVTVDAGQFPVEQIAKQVDKLINVIKIRDLDPKHAIARELALIKVRADASSRGEVIQLVEIFRGEIVDVTTESVTIQVTGGSDELVNFEQLVQPFGVIELVKTGVVALGRGASAT